jgi:hypothetical protein
LFVGGVAEYLPGYFEVVELEIGGYLFPVEELGLVVPDEGGFVEELLKGGLGESGLLGERGCLWKRGLREERRGLGKGGCFGLRGGSYHKASVNMVEG